MRLRARIAMLVFAAAFAAAPVLAIAAAGCGSCCCPPVPCHGTAADCETMLGSMSCCNEAPFALPSVAKRTHEAPSLQTVIPSRAIFAPVLSARSRPPARADVDAVILQLRRSVVLRI